MAFTNSNGNLQGTTPPVFPAGAEVVAVRGEISLVANDLDANDAGSVVVLPAGCVPVAAYLDSEDLDTNGAPTIVAQVGIMNTADSDLSTAAADGGAVWQTGITICQTGGQVAVLGRPMTQVAAASVDRRVGVKFSAAAATKAAGRIGITLLYRGA